VTASARARVFISYSHHDVKWLERLRVHLKPLIRKQVVDLWDDTRISPGMDWRREIDTALSAASVAVLLISADFLASDFIVDNELPVLRIRCTSPVLGSVLFRMQDGWRWTRGSQDGGDCSGGGIVNSPRGAASWVGSRRARVRAQYWGASSR